jgi:hypothetical protein
MPTHTLGKHPICHTNTNESIGKTAVTSGGRPSRLRLTFEAERHLCMAQSQPLDSNTSRESQVSNTLSRELLDSEMLIKH